MAIRSMRVKGYGLLFLSALCFGSFGVWSRLLGQGFPIFYQAAVRSALILLIILPYMIAAKKFRRVDWHDRAWLWVCIVFDLAINVPIFYAFNHLALGTASLIFYAAVLITSYLIGAIWLREQMTRTKLISLGLAFVGLLITFGFSLAAFSIVGLLLAMVSGVATGGESSASKKITHRYPSLMVVFWSWVAVVTTHAPLSLLLHEHWIMPAWNGQWLAMLLYAVTGLAGFWLVIEGFKFVDASIGGLIGLLEIVFSAFLGVVLFHDVLMTATFIGGMFILVAAMLSDLRDLIHNMQEKATGLSGKKTGRESHTTNSDST